MKIEAGKRMSDLTPEEIIYIVSDTAAYNRLIDLECAHKGTRLLPEHPGPKPLINNSEGDTTLYNIGNWYFESVAAATAIVDLINKSNPVGCTSKAGKKVIKELESYYAPKIETSPAFSKAGFDLIEGEAREDSNKISEWDSRKDTYDKIMNERNSVVSEFDNLYHDIKCIRRGIADIIANFKRYIDLANGDYNIACNFLVDACKNDSTIVDNYDIYFIDYGDKQHLAISREEYREGKMNELLGVHENEDTSSNT